MGTSVIPTTKMKLFKLLHGNFVFLLVMIHLSDMSSASNDCDQVASDYSKNSSLVSPTTVSLFGDELFIADGQKHAKMAIR